MQDQRKCKMYLVKRQEKLKKESLKKRGKYQDESMQNHKPLKNLDNLSVTYFLNAKCGM